MRKAAARDGDLTTTGGRVFACASPIKDKGRSIAFDGSEASCGNCEGVFPVHGTGQKIFNAGRYAIVDDDRVLCPCGRNRVIVGGSPGVWLTVRSCKDRANQEDADPIRDKPLRGAKIFDEQVRVWANSGVLDGYPYFIEMVDGQSFFGRVDSGGVLPRMSTGTSRDDYIVYWGEDALIKANAG
ncbi:PAAR domain-containing protein [Paraburkholderia sp. BR14263]|uniref:PAAR domain-containing protein n=1 Tax=Paraburkholderia guartelaensis TaxID=2546446 RepID=A0ABU9SDV9_9BURK